MNSLLISIFSLSLIVPKPVFEIPVLENGEQVRCVIDVNDVSVYSDPLLAKIIPVWSEFLKGMGEKMTLSTVSVSSKCELCLHFNRKLQEEEYLMTMRRDRIVIDASSTKGAWWALQSLTQLFISQAFAPEGAKPGVFEFPAVYVHDKPAFKYRGAHLDCCRHFFTVDEVKRYIDLMCLHKLNVFHWHLTDDQGWRFQVNKYPRLTKVGAVRKETKAGHARDEEAGYDGTPYGEGCFYTQADCREIVRYAQQRGITVIPEFEMPGHALAALASYPYLGCTGGPYDVWTTWGVSPEVMCLGKESTYTFIRDVLNEICEVFPSKYIHIGGDEAPVTQRKTCPACQAKMKELGIADPVKLQGRLIETVEAYLKTRGREIIGWNEIMDTGVSENAVVMCWTSRGMGGGEVAKRGNKVIRTDGPYFYFDHYQTESRKDEPLAIGGYIPLSKTYAFNPFEGVEAKDCDMILGVQGNLWTEYIADFEHLQKMALPRFAALAEVAWSSKKDDFSVFVQRVRTSMLPVYEHFHFSYAPYGFE